jgi:hypothetical protein
MDRSLALRAGALQAASVAAVSLALAALLDRSFFEEWGWLAGPGAWGACALITARVLSLPLARTLLGAAVAGVLSLVALLAGAHWLGAALAVVAFGVWCGRFGTAAGPSAPS